jgi:putative ABC transport system permease protein
VTVFRIVARNLAYRKLATILLALSVSLGVGLMTAILHLKNQAHRSFQQSALGYNLIVGAKGSPLQLTLNVVYHLDSPVGNLPFQYYEAIKHDPRVKLAVPFLLGDSYRGCRIVGTTREYFADFEFEKGRGFKIARGELFASGEQAVLGAQAAREASLKVGDSFQASHGIVERGKDAGTKKHPHPFRVVGILQPTNTPNDRAIFVPMEAFWEMHNSKPNEREITAVIVQLKSPLHQAQIYRAINDSALGQAVIPGIQIQTLFRIVGSIDRVLFLISIVVVVVAAAGIMVALYNSMAERRREVAILRALGAHRGIVFAIILLESAAICLVGGLLGSIWGHLSLLTGHSAIEAAAGFALNPWLFDPQELVIILGVTLLGAVAGALPAVAAYRADVVSSLNPAT